MAGIPRCVALAPDEVGRRIRAARELNGLDQTDLAALLVEQGLGKTDAGRLERGDLVMQSVHRSALARALSVPEGWFVLAQDELLGGIRRAFLSVGLPSQALNPATLQAVEALIDKRLSHIEQVVEAVEQVLSEQGDATREAMTATRGVTQALKGRAVGDQSEREAVGGTHGEEDATQESGRAPHRASR